MYVEAKTDKRPFFILPWNDRYLIGTTDIRYDGDLDEVRSDAQEIEYLLRETNQILPALKLRRANSSTPTQAFARYRSRMKLTNRALRVGISFDPTHVTKICFRSSAAN